MEVLKMRSIDFIKINNQQEKNNLFFSDFKDEEDDEQ